MLEGIKDQPFVLAIVLVAGLYFGDKWISSTAPTMTDFQSTTATDIQLIKQELSTLNTNLGTAQQATQDRIKAVEGVASEAFTRREWEIEKRLLRSEVERVIEIEIEKNQKIKN